MLIPKTVVAFAVDKLATVDYTIANRVTHSASEFVHFVYDHELPTFLVPLTVQALQSFDDIGSLLISLVLWIAAHSM